MRILRIYYPRNVSVEPFILQDVEITIVLLHTLETYMADLYSCVLKILRTSPLSSLDDVDDAGLLEELAI